MDIESIVRDFAERGFSRLETARTLELSYRKFQHLIKDWTDIPWRPNGSFKGQQDSRAASKGYRTSARTAAISRANQAKLAKVGVLYNGVLDFPRNHWKRYAHHSVSWGLFKRRYWVLKWELGVALTKPNPLKRGKRKPDTTFHGLSYSHRGNPQ